MLASIDRSKTFQSTSRLAGYGTGEEVPSAKVSGLFGAPRVGKKLEDDRRSSEDLVPEPTDEVEVSARPKSTWCVFRVMQGC